MKKIILWSGHKKTKTYADAMSSVEHYPFTWIQCTMPHNIMVEDTELISSLLQLHSQLSSCIVYPVLNEIFVGNDFNV